MDSDILILVLAVGASIVSAIVKGVKKNAQKKSIPTADVNDHDEDPWETIKRYVSDADKPVREVVVEQERRAVESVAVHNYEDESSFNRLKAQRLREVQQRRDAIVAARKESVKSAEVTSHTNDDGDMLSNFNLKTAVIYSEILKPKFDE